MRSPNIIAFVFYYFVFLVFQILLFKNLSLFNYALCFIYVGFILLLPFSISHLLLIVISFLVGISIDIFYDTLGIHAASCVLIAYVRPYIINVLTPKGGYDKGTEVSVAAQGFQWMIIYSSVLIFIHHLTLFVLEVWGVKLFFTLITKTMASTLFTVVVFTLFQYLFQSPRNYK
jgi:hypothetical protein